MKITDPFEKLFECHDHILTRLSLFEESLRAIEQQKVVGFLSEKENIKQTFDFIDTSIVLHTRDEEEGLFPKLRPRLEEQLPLKGEGATPVDVMEGEHRMAEEVIARLKELAVSMERNAHASNVTELVDEFHEKGTWVIQAYQKHIWKENNVLFPMAQQMLSSQDKTEVADVMNELRNQAVAQ